MAVPRAMLEKPLVRSQARRPYDPPEALLGSAEGDDIGGGLGAAVIHSSSGFVLALAIATGRISSPSWTEEGTEASD